MTDSAIALQQQNEVGRSKRAIVFARARSRPRDAQRDQAQLRAQLRHCREVAERLGAEVVSEYGVIGGTTEPVVTQMVEKMLDEAIQGGGIDYVIVGHVDRLSRRPAELARIATRLAARSTQLVTTADPATRFGEQIRLFCLLEVAQSGRRTA